MKPFLIPTKISFKNEDTNYMDVEISLIAGGNLSKYYDKKKGTINTRKIMLDILLGEI